MRKFVLKEKIKSGHRAKLNLEAYEIGVIYPL